MGIGYAPSLPPTLPPAGTPHFIDNRGCAPAAGARATIEVLDAASEKVIATLPEAAAADVDAAFDAARRAFPAWSSLRRGAGRCVQYSARATATQRYHLVRTRPDPHPAARSLATKK